MPGHKACDSGFLSMQGFRCLSLCVMAVSKGAVSGCLPLYDRLRSACLACFLSGHACRILWA